MEIYKINFGENGNRGIDYASQVNKEIVKSLWGHDCEIEVIDNLNYVIKTMCCSPLSVKVELIEVEVIN